MLNLQNVQLRRGTRVLSEGATFTIYRGEKVGITGANGSGKSSLLALVRGELHAEGGDFSRPSGLSIASVEQETPAVTQSAIDYVLDGAEPRGAAPRGVGFATADLEQPVASFSGGWRMRLNLARALMCRSDLLLLDKPTNHLDLDAVIWLESRLAAYRGTLLLIAHDVLQSPPMTRPHSPDSQPARDPAAARQRRRHRRWVIRSLLLGVGLAWASVAFWHTYKPMPPGTDLASAWLDAPLSDVRLLTDVAVTDGRGRLIIHQQIFDEVLRIIDAAQEFIVLDWFLFNDHRGFAASKETAVHRSISAELRDRLVARRNARPDLRVLFITDPINEIYGSVPSADLEALRAAGVEVVLTDLDPLRDSNPIYSALWRLTVRWWADDGPGEGWLPNPLDTGPTRVSLRAWLRLLNFKANHRKLVVADDGKRAIVALVTSANPHDASSAHSNIGLKFSGATAQAALTSELDVARFSGWQGDWQPPTVTPTQDAVNVARLKLLTEGSIEDALENAIRTAEAGESIAIAIFHLADRDIVNELIDAAARDVRIRLILDPNKDAFGRVKDGVPNRPVAAELYRRSSGRIEIRWYRTHGEQFHTKLALVRRADSIWAMLGSANFTRRNLENYNLETDVALEAGLATPLAQELISYFETLWQNDPVALREFTTDFQTYEDQSFTRYWRYRLMEATGLSTF